MARILVVGPRAAAANATIEALTARLRNDGHDAEATYNDLPATVREADAVVAVLDPLSPEAAAAAAIANTLHKPVLGLRGDGGPTSLDDLCDRVTEAPPAQWGDALPGFYEAVRPFAGRLVRDLVPRLVRDAGYDVRFRALESDEKPRFLKQKVLEEARQLMEAEMGAEKEEVADLLEALEALIRARDYGRDALKQVKQAKHKRRGGFERGWVVESTVSSEPATPEQLPDASPDAPPEEQTPPATQDPQEEPAPQEARSTQFFEV